MKKIFNIEKYSIMLECNGKKGTGVFMSSKSPEYDYIITAKHCLETYESTSDIIFPDNSFSVANIFIHDNLDLAIIKVEKSNQSSFFSFVDIEELEKYEEKIYLYGYPKIFEKEEIKYCKLECKYDTSTYDLIRLKVMDEISTFKYPAIKVLKGMSGSPAYIQKDEVVIFLGIYYQNSHEDFAYNHIDIIPLYTIQNMIRNNNLEDLNLSFCSELMKDDLDPLYINYDKLVRDDFRNLKEKITQVSPTYNNKKISFLSRKVVNTTLEIDRLSYKRKAALLYRIFLCANEKQLDLVLENKKLFNPSEVDKWIDKYTDYAKEIIDDKSEEYKYCLKSRDIIKGIILQLIDDCYISFDEKGYYYKEDDDDI